MASRKSKWRVLYKQPFQFQHRAYFHYESFPPTFPVCFPKCCKAGRLKVHLAEVIVVNCTTQYPHTDCNFFRNYHPSIQQIVFYCCTHVWDACTRFVPATDRANSRWSLAASALYSPLPSMYVYGRHVHSLCMHLPHAAKTLSFSPSCCFRLNCFWTLPVYFICYHPAPHLTTISILS